MNNLGTKSASFLLPDKNTLLNKLRRMKKTVESFAIRINIAMIKTNIVEIKPGKQ